MPSKIDPRLTPKLPAAWETPANKVALSADEIDALLSRKIDKVAWRDATAMPLTLDPVTRKPMVDPVLCSDGKLHDRINTRALPYLDADTNGTRTLTVQGRDLQARNGVHNAFTQAPDMLKNRQAIAAHINANIAATAALAAPGAVPAPATPVVAAQSEAAPALPPEERTYRKYQCRTRQGELRFELNDGITRRPDRLRPLIFSRNTFIKFGVLPQARGLRQAYKDLMPNHSHRLTNHLVDYGVLQGRKKAERTLGDLGGLEAALDTFNIDNRNLTEDEKAGVRKYVGFFARLTRAVWPQAAELELNYSAFEKHERLRTAAQAQMQPAESRALNYHAQVMRLRVYELAHQIINSREVTSPAFVASSPPKVAAGLLSVRRTQSLQDLRLSDSAKSVDADMFYCPVLLETAPAPVLCSDGHNYDISQLLAGNLTKSPLTREPMQMVARHSERQLWASQLVDKQEASYFRETYDALREAYPAYKGGFADRVVAYQRRPRKRRSGPSLPDTLSRNIFREFVDVSSRHSSVLFNTLRGHGLVNRLLDHCITPQATRETLQVAIDAYNAQAKRPLMTTQQSDVNVIVSVLKTEQARRTPLVAQARYLAKHLTRLEKGTPRYRVVSDNLARVHRELHKLPSGVDDGSDAILY